jgi:hypothetical protein
MFQEFFFEGTFMNYKKIYVLLLIIASSQNSFGSGSAAAYKVTVAPKQLKAPSPRGSSSPHFGPKKPTVTTLTAVSSASAAGIASAGVQTNGTLQLPAAAANHNFAVPMSPPTTDRSPIGVGAYLTPLSQNRVLTSHHSPHSAVHALAPHCSPVPSDGGSSGDVGNSPRSLAHSISKSNGESESHIDVKLQRAREQAAWQDREKLKIALKGMLQNRINLGGLNNSWQQFNAQQAQKHKEKVRFSDFAYDAMREKAQLLIKEHHLNCLVDEHLDGFITGFIQGFEADQAAKKQESNAKKKEKEDSGCSCCC